MHIGFLTTEYPPLPSGGIGTSIRNLGRALVEQGHRVSVIGWGKEASFLDSGVNVQMLPAAKITHMGWISNRIIVVRHINRLVVDEGLQIVESPDWCGLSAGMQLRCPVVIRCNGSDSYFSQILKYPLKFRNWLPEMMALHTARDIASVSQFTASVTREKFRLKKHIQVIPNGIDIRNFEPSFSKVGATVLYFGTLIRKKGALDLPKIINQVSQKKKSAKFLLAGGDAPDRLSGNPSTWEMINSELSPSAKNKTFYLGKLPYDEIVSLIREAAVCIFPSYAEALPLSWLEAMACGKPIVAYDFGWSPEVVDHNKTGVLVPLRETQEFSEAVVRLLNSADFRREMGEGARKKAVKEFSSERVAKLSLEWYRKNVA